MRKQAQQITTMLLMGLRLDSRVCTNHSSVLAQFRPITAHLHHQLEPGRAVDDAQWPQRADQPEHAQHPEQAVVFICIEDIRQDSRASNEGSRRFHNHGEGPY